MRRTADKGHIFGDFAVDSYIEASPRRHVSEAVGSAAPTFEAEAGAYFGDETDRKGGQRR